MKSEIERFQKWMHRLTLINSWLDVLGLDLAELVSQIESDSSFADIQQQAADETEKKIQDLKAGVRKEHPAIEDKLNGGRDNETL